MKKISIITINLNMKHGLQRTLKSISEQNVNRLLFEVIVIDGGSRDGSHNIIESNSNLIDVAIIESDDGIFDAMNKGVRHASGDFVYFLNSGDTFYDCNTLNNLLGTISENAEHSILRGKVATYINSKFLRNVSLEKWPVHQATLIKTSLIKKYMFDKKYKIFGDLDLWYRLDKDRAFMPREINFIFANMTIDGVGTHPKYALRRLMDKLRFNLKHSRYLRSISDITTLLLDYFVYCVIGEKYYYTKYINFRSIAKKVICNPRTAISVLSYAIYSIMMFPFRSLLYRQVYWSTKIRQSSKLFHKHHISLGKNVKIEDGVIIRGSDINIGHRTQINPNTVLYGKIHVGDSVLIGPNCTLAGGNHTIDEVKIDILDQGSSSKGIIIERNVWIGANCVILDGVTIREGTVIGAGSTISKNTEMYSIYTGSAASIKKIRYNT